MRFTVGQHRDLKINYDYLCEINSIVKKYIDALEELQSETEAFVEKINNQEGDVFVELKNEYEDAIAVDYTDLIDILKEIYHVSGRYIEEMQYYIAPENSSMLCRVDRNDIWWNLQQIKAIPYAYVEAYPHVPSHYYMDEFVNPFADDADEVRARNEDRRRRRENNYNKLVDFYNNTIRSTADGLWQDTEDLKSIYENYVVEYENTDDIYARKMDELYDSIKTWIDIAGDLWQGTKDLLRGFGTGIVDLAKGLKAPLEIVLAISPTTPLPIGVRIAFLYDGGMEIYQGTKVFIKDPENTIGAMFQGMFDTGDEEGTAFCVGYATEKIVEVIVAKKVADAMAGPKGTGEGAVPVESTGDSVTYRRVQGGTGNNASQVRIKVNSDGSISIPNKDVNLSVSIDSGEHAEYFLNKRGGNATVVEVEVPKWFDDFLQENSIPQVNYKTNPLNQGGAAPKITDITTPGNCFELPAPWIEWLEEYGTNAQVIFK